MTYTWEKKDAGVVRFIESSVYAIDVGGRIYTLAYVDPENGYKFKPIAGACTDKSLYLGNFTTQGAAIDAALKDDYTVYEFGNEDEFYAWLGQRYAATVPPAADVPAVMNKQRITALEDKVSQVESFWQLRFSDVLKKIEAINGKFKQEDVPTRWGPLDRADGLYIVSNPGINYQFIARSKGNTWYILSPGKEEKYLGYLTVYSKVDMHG